MNHCPLLHEDVKLAASGRVSGSTHKCREMAAKLCGTHGIDIARMRETDYQSREMGCRQRAVVTRINLVSGTLALGLRAPSKRRGLLSNYMTLITSTPSMTFESAVCLHYVR